jgi:hypothetical protein
MAPVLHYLKLVDQVLPQMLRLAQSFLHLNLNQLGMEVTQPTCSKAMDSTAVKAPANMVLLVAPEVINPQAKVTRTASTEGIKLSVATTMAIVSNEAAGVAIMGTINSHVRSCTSLVIAASSFGGCNFTRNVLLLQDNCFLSYFVLLLTQFALWTGK